MSPPHPSFTIPAEVPTSGRRLRRLIAPNERSRLDLLRSVPLGLVGMIALVAAIEATVAGRPLDYLDPASLSWRLAADAARDEAPGCRVLCVGDSLVKHGVIPAIVEAGTGRRTANLAVARGPAPATYFLLRRALDAGARPDAVVLDFKPSVLIGGPRHNLRSWQEILSAREALELTLEGGAGPSWPRSRLGRLLPSFRSRHEVRGHILAALRGDPSPLRLTNRMCRRNWLVNDGANVAARNPAFRGAPGPNEKAPISDRWYCQRVNAAYRPPHPRPGLAHGIRVYWLLPPISPWLQARREATGAEAGYLRLVRSSQARHPNLTIVDGRHSGYDHTVFVDTTHLDGQGAAVLSADLAALLARDLPTATAPGRWLELPPYRPRPPAIPLEDVEQSRRVVLATPGRPIR